MSTDTATTDTDLGRVAFLASHRAEAREWKQQEWERYPALHDHWEAIAAAVRAEVEREMVARYQPLVEAVEFWSTADDIYTADMDIVESALAALRGENT